jgi:hypothetical protein
MFGAGIAANCARIFGIFWNQSGSSIPLKADLMAELRRRDCTIAAQRPHL